jgi:predicted  nucleic acid-binding Zn-ribbon protein
MTVTKQLLELFRVDKQLRGLRNRLDTAERFLSQQSQLLTGLDAQKKQLESESKLLKATHANEEGEAARLEKKLTALREQMNTAKNSKEYNAILAELNTFKTEKSGIETRVLEGMARVDEIKGKLEAISAQHAERTKIVQGAKADRDARHAEIKERLEELTAQRSTLVQAIPTGIKTEFENLVKTRGDEAMVAVEIIDKRAHECSCSACMMAIPVEAVNGLLTGKLTKCPSCRCFLYMETETWENSEAGAKPKKKSKKEAASL